MSAAVPGLEKRPGKTNRRQADGRPADHDPSRISEREAMRIKPGDSCFRQDTVEPLEDLPTVCGPDQAKQQPVEKAGESPPQPVLRGRGGNLRGDPVRAGLGDDLCEANGQRH